MVDKGIVALKLYRAGSRQTRITFRLHNERWPDEIHEDGPDAGECVAVSVLADIPANPLLLSVQLQALQRARGLLDQQIEAVTAALSASSEGH